MQEYNPYTTAQAQFDAIAQTLGLSSGMCQYLRQPSREFVFTIPVAMDDGSTKVFQGIRIVHNDTLGPGKGGIRFHPEESVDTVRALSMWMTWKCAVADIPLGGAKGGIIFDPREHSMAEQQRICRGYIRQLAKLVGPILDVPAPDMMSNAQHMLWMLDEYETIFGGKYPGMITGKPVGMGGSLGRAEATGYGIVYCLREALEGKKIDIAKTTMSMQGFGKVGMHAAALYYKLGGKVTAISCWDNQEKQAFTYCKKEGLNIPELINMTDSFGTIAIDQARKIGIERLGGEEWISQPVDILLPAALENQITEHTVKQIAPTVQFVCEGANGPTSNEGDKALNEKGIFVIPDFLCNAGGVTCSYFEQVQCNQNYFWDKDEVLEKLDKKMTSAFHSVYNEAIQHGIPMRDSAYRIGISRVAASVRMRGLVT